MDAFLDEVPSLFSRLHEKERDAYEEILYGLRVPATGPLLDRMARFRGGPSVPDLQKPGVADRVGSALRQPMYPSSEILVPLRGIHGLSLAQATTVLHFHHPAYPIYGEPAVRALNRMGFAVVYRTETDEDGLGAYDGYVAALDRMKQRIPFADVPETNCFLSRIIECALTAAA